MAIPGRQTIGNIKLSSPVTMNNEYLIFIPAGYSKGSKCLPLILFLHGAGERGRSIESVKRHGLPKFLDSENDFPFIVASPQCREDMRWNPAELICFLDEVAAAYNADKSRIYLTGLSMGGFGTWLTALKYPDRFAAIAPVCGGGDPSIACNIKDLPVWAFHGAKDKVVPIERSIEMIDAIKYCGGSPLFTVYPDAGHDSWTETYNNPGLYEWFLKNKR